MIFLQLNVMGKTTDWLSDPKIFGNYNVAYVSTGSSQKGNPAGGRFRGRLGRALFRQVDITVTRKGDSDLRNVVNSSRRKKWCSFNRFIFYKFL